MSCVLLSPPLVLCSIWTGCICISELILSLRFQFSFALFPWDNRTGNRQQQWKTLDVHLPVCVLGGSGDAGDCNGVHSLEVCW